MKLLMIYQLKSQSKTQPNRGKFLSQLNYVKKLKRPKFEVYKILKY